MSIEKAFNGRVTCHKQMISTEIKVERIVEENRIQHHRYIALNENNLAIFLSIEAIYLISKKINEDIIKIKLQLNVIVIFF